MDAGLINASGSGAASHCCRIFRAIQSKKNLKCFPSCTKFLCSRIHLLKSNLVFLHGLTSLDTRPHLKSAAKHVGEYHSKPSVNVISMSRNVNALTGRVCTGIRRLASSSTTAAGAETQLFSGRPEVLSEPLRPHSSHSFSKRHSHSISSSVGRQARPCTSLHPSTVRGSCSCAMAAELPMKPTISAQPGTVKPYSHHVMIRIPPPPDHAPADNSIWWPPVIEK